MFVRVKRKPNRPNVSIQIVSNVRDEEGKTKQKVLRHVGVARTEDELKRMKDLAEFIKADLEATHQKTVFPPEEVADLAIAEREKKEAENKPIPVDDLRDIEEVQRSVVGIHEIYGEMYKQLGFENIFSGITYSKFAPNYLKNLVMARIANPQSKAKTVRTLAEDFGIQLKLDRVYQMMDWVNNDVTERIQKNAHEAAQRLFQQKIDILFYDATTLYFESFQEGELQKNGFSKDQKHNQPQVLLAVMVTKHGIPVGYETFEGNTYEGDTLEKSLAALKKRYEIDNVVFVADSGMLSAKNIELMEEKNLKYIVGARLKNTKEHMHRIIWDLSLYRETDSDDVQVLDYQKENEPRLVVSFSAVREKKDRFDRQKNIEKMRAKLQKSSKPSSIISTSGYKKYLTVEGESRVIVDEKKVSEDARWDGLKGIYTNITDQTPEELMSHYKGLWQVEESFRVSKHDLKVRPIFHWTKDRINAHIAICFMALTCVRHLEFRIASQYKKLSPEVIRNVLMHVQVTLLRHKKTGQKYGLPSKITSEAKRIYGAMGKQLSPSVFLTS